jgi:protein kinase X
MIAGVDPFADDDPMNVYEKILSGKIKFTPNFDLDAKSLVRRLLQSDLSKRYGNLKGGVNDIKYHKFFKNMNFDKLLNQELKPPYVPKVTSPSDVSNFAIYPESNREINDVLPRNDPFINW